MRGRDAAAAVITAAQLAVGVVHPDGVTAPRDQAASQMEAQRNESKGAGERVGTAVASERGKAGDHRKK